MKLTTKTFAVLVCVAYGVANAYGDLYTASRATVRVSCGDGIGSGIVAGANGEAYYALTNAHVVPLKSCQVQFFDGGFSTVRINAECVSRDIEADVAVVRIPKTELKEYVPDMIPIDPAYTLKTGETLGTIGTPHGQHPTAYMCTYYQTSSLGMEFQPPPKEGRSGSALFDRDFSRVIGLVWAKTTDGTNMGLAVPARRFSRALGQTLTTDQVAEDSNAPRFKVSENKSRVTRLTCYDISDVTPLNATQTTQCPGGNCPTDGAAGGKEGRTPLFPNWRPFNGELSERQTMLHPLDLSQ